MKQKEFDYQVRRVRASLDRVQGATNAFRIVNNSDAKNVAQHLNDELHEARCAIDNLRRARVKGGEEA